MQNIHPTDEQLAALAALPEDGSALFMLNLLAYREQAAYRAQDAQPACSGREAFKRYSKLSIGCIERAGGRVIFIGAARGTVIGPAEENWDEIFLVQYPSRRAFLDMIASDAYNAIAFHRTAALRDSRLIAISAKFNAAG
jgi:uncharacterized protein (DUF1330 family)